jgi:hypothetical protein
MSRSSPALESTDESSSSTGYRIEIFIPLSISSPSPPSPLTLSLADLSAEHESRGLAITKIKKASDKGMCYQAEQSRWKREGEGDGGVESNVQREEREKVGRRRELSLPVEVLLDFGGPGKPVVSAVIDRRGCDVSGEVGRKGQQKGRERTKERSALRSARRRPKSPSFAPLFRLTSRPKSC